MTFQINGSKGAYDYNNLDESTKYAKNAIDNHMKAMSAPIVNDEFNPAPILDFVPTEEAADRNIAAIEKFADKNDAYLESLPPLEYEYRYMPETQPGTIDKQTVIAHAKEEMGKDEMSVEEFEDRFLIDKDYMTAEPLDINKDGKIDAKEYSTNIIAADILSKGSEDPLKADGVINSKGLNAVLEYSQKSRADAAAKLYASIYKAYNLGE